MPTLTAADGSPYPYSQQALATGTKSTGGVTSSKPKPKNNGKKPPPGGNGDAPSRPSSSYRRSPSPPPAATEIQLKMWHAVLLRRTRQIQRLSRPYLLSFANDIISDLSVSRYETNEYTKDLEGGDKENDQSGVDLVSGHYKPFLLTERPPPSNISADEIGLHMLALFYRSVDNRLPNAMRKHGIDALRRACLKLELWLSKCEAGETIDTNISEVMEASGGASCPGKNKRKSTDSVQKNGGNKIQNESRAENASLRSNNSGERSNKKMRMDAPEMNVNSARAGDLSGTAQRPGKVFVPPKPQGNGGDKNNEKVGGKSRKDSPPVSGSKQRPDVNSSEKDKASGKAIPVPASQRINSHYAVPSQKGLTQQRPEDKGEKSQKGEGKRPPQPRQSLGNRFSPPQKGPNEILQEQRSVRSRTLGPSSSAFRRMNSENSASSQRGTATITQFRPQRTYPPRPNQATPQTSVSNQRTEAAVSNQPPPSKTASLRTVINDLASPKEGAVATAQNERMGNNERQGNAGKSTIAHVAEKLSKSKTSTAATSNAKTGHTQKSLPLANEGAGIESGDDVIDLMSDSSDDESPPSQKPPLAPGSAPDSTASRGGVKRRDEENSAGVTRPVVSRGPPPPPSPPASPLPAATVHNPPPSPRPKPKPFSDRRSLAFNADGNARHPTASGSLRARASCVVSFDAGFHLDGSGSCLDDALCIDVNERLKTWDPYWQVVEVLGTREVPVDTSQGGHGMTSVGTRTTPCVPAYQAGPPLPPEFPSSCASVCVDLQKEVLRSKFSNRDSSGKSLPQGYRPWGVRWGSLSHPYTDEKGRERDRLQTGDRRLIVRTLPLQRTPKDMKKRADGHLWPKGTFLQLKQGVSEQVLTILQRKQQSHAHAEWKGISHPLDLTLKVPTTNHPLELKLCSKEIVENSANYVDAVNGTLMGSYALHVAICEYVAPDDLYDRLMGKASGGDVTIPRISLRSGRKMAREYLAGQTVLLDDSDDEGEKSKGDVGKNVEDSKSLTFSLLCPISKTAMQTPVRGRHCKHMQCMDLKNFLHANKNMTGGRWRCGACESFVNVRDLVHCGLFQAMLDALGNQVTGARDRVSLRADGNWKLMEENRLRYNKRGGSLSTSTQAEANNVNAGGKRPPTEPEVIELV